jgi:hypothetical protein
MRIIHDAVNNVDDRMAAAYRDKRESVLTGIGGFPRIFTVNPTLVAKIF